MGYANGPTQCERLASSFELLRLDVVNPNGQLVTVYLMHSATCIVADVLGCIALTSNYIHGSIRFCV